jgi:hypothetical protein
MGIDEAGFLSPEIAGYIQKHRAGNGEWFHIAEDLNHLAQRQLLSFSVPDHDQGAIISTLLFIRGLSNFQGAIILAERGMSPEARILTRSCFEAIFCLVAIGKDPTVLNVLVGDDAARRRKTARAQLKDASGLVPDEIEILQRVLEEEASAPELNLERVAHIAGLSKHYDIFYRALSNFSAHPSMTALFQHLQADEQGLATGLQWGPDGSDIEVTLMAACYACVRLVAWAGDTLKSAEMNEEWRRCCDAYHRMIGEMGKRVRPT